MSEPLIKLIFHELFIFLRRSRGLDRFLDSADLKSFRNEKR